jgi:hypothetical protein
MPGKGILKKRGGLMRIRTKKVSATQYVHIYVTRKKGKRGGRTIAGEVRRKK